MAELQDYSGPFNPDLKFEDFSKEFLIKLIKRYASGYLKLGEFWYDRVLPHVGEEKAMCEDSVIAWSNQAYWMNPKIAKTANIDVKCIVDVMKVWQLVLDGFLPERYIPSFEVKGPNHVIMDIVYCRDFIYYQHMNMTDRIVRVCGLKGVEHRAMEAYMQCFLPNAQVKQLAGPPASGMPAKEGVCCQWEYTNKPL